MIGTPPSTYGDKQETLNKFYNTLFVDDSGQSGRTTPTATVINNFNPIPAVSHSNSNVTTFPHQPVVISTENQNTAAAIRHQFLFAFSVAIFVLSLIIFILGATCASLNSEQAGFYYCQNGSGVWSAIFAITTACIGIATSRYHNRCLTLGFMIMASICCLLMIALIIISATYTAESARTLRYLYVTTYWQANLSLLRAYCGLNVALLAFGFLNLVCLISANCLILYQWTKPGGLCGCCAMLQKNENPVTYVASTQPDSHTGTMTLRNAKGQQFILLPVQGGTEATTTAVHPSPTSSA